MVCAFFFPFCFSMHFNRDWSNYYETKMKGSKTMHSTLTFQGENVRLGIYLSYFLNVKRFLFLWIPSFWVNIVCLNTTVAMKR